MTLTLVLNGCSFLMRLRVKMKYLIGFVGVVVHFELYFSLYVSYS